MNKPTNVNCLMCGKACYMPNNRIKSFKYCSRACKHKSNIIQIKANCQICGEIFTHISCRANKAKYCSRKCYHKAQENRGNTTYKCRHCGQEFRDSLSRKRIYCSKACVNKSSKENWNPTYTTVRKKMILSNKVNKCEKCGYNENRAVLGIHHKDGNRKNNTKKNLEVLCANCHSIEHIKHICHSSIGL